MTRASTTAVFLILFALESFAGDLQSYCDEIAIKAVRKQVELFASDFELDKVEKGPTPDSHLVVYNYVKSGMMSKCYGADALVITKRDLKKQTCEILGKPRIKSNGDCRQEP